MSKRPATNPNPMFHLELPLKLLECSQWRKLLFLFLQQEITARKNSRFELELKTFSDFITKIANCGRR